MKLLPSEGLIKNLLMKAERFVASGRQSEAIGVYNEILAIDPENAVALNGLGNRMLASGDARSACSYLARASAIDPKAPWIWLNLSIAYRLAGDPGAELQALDQALIADPYFMIALLEKARWFERNGRAREAVRAYRSLLEAVPLLDNLSGQFKDALAHARELVQKDNAEIDSALRASTATLEIKSERFEHCVDILVGRRKVYVQQPVGLHFPYLPAVQFFDRELFPWLKQLEGSTRAIRAELEQLIADDFASTPYVQISEGQPVNQWKDLNHSLAWSAIYLCKNGVLNAPVIERCPAAWRALSALPLTDIPNQGATIMFSTLKPYTVIPPHHGITNTRSVVHLPLIVPEGCSFRVGSEDRVLEEGLAWVFDDTIEHEATNRSDEVRVILIADIWNPYLTEDEKSLLRTANLVLQELA
jgi:aspartate beta-hydroxylase